MAVRNLEALLPHTSPNIFQREARSLRPHTWMARLLLAACLSFSGLPTGGSAQPLVEPGTGLQLSMQSYSINLSQPEPILLELPYAGRFVLQLKSAVGVAIQLEDRLSGLGPRAGRAGELDGRLDVFLDAGPARVRLQVPPGATGNAVLEVRGVEETHPIRSFMQLQREEQQPLDDGQQFSAWLEVTEPEELLLEARGEALRDLRIWRDGLWLLPDLPLCRLEPEGAARRWCRMATRLEPGTYRVTFYGGERLPQPTGAASPTLTYRAQLPLLAPNLLEQRTVSPLGIERFELPPEAGYARVTFASPTPAQLSFASGAGETLLGAGMRSVSWGDAERKGGKLPVLELELDKTGQRRVLSLEAPPGTPFTLQVLNPMGTSLPLSGAGPHRLGVLVAGQGEAPPVTALLIRRKDESPSPASLELVSKAALKLDPQLPVVRRFNLQGKTGFFLDVTQAGDYKIQLDGCPATAVLEPVLFERPPSYRSPEPKRLPFSQALEPRLYALQLDVASPAICTLRLNHGNAVNAEYIMPSPTEVYANLGEVTLESDARYMVVRPPLEGARVGITQERISPEILRPARLLSPLPNLPTLREGQKAYFDLGRTQAMQVQVQLQEAGLYRLESVGLLKLSGQLSSALGGSLQASAGSGSGRNYRFETWLQPGNYLLTTRAEGESAGRLGLSLSRLPLRDAGKLELNQSSTLALQPREGALYTLQVPSVGRYELTSQRMGRLARVRLEDQAGFPLLHEQGGSAELELRPGTHRLIVLPEAVEQRVQTRLTTKAPLPRYEGHGPHALPLTQLLTHEWREPEAGAERIPDRFTFELPATSDLGLLLTDDMHASLFREGQNSPVGYVPPNRGAVLALEAGKYRLEVTSFRPNHRQTYRVMATPALLLPGLTRTLSLPTTQRLAVGRPGAYAVSTWCSDDARARLTLPAGRIVAEADDVGADWSPRLEALLPAGPLSLQLDALQANVYCAVTLESLGADAEKRLRDQPPTLPERSAEGIENLISIRANESQVIVKEANLPSAISQALRQRLVRTSWTSRSLTPTRSEGGRLQVSLKSGETGQLNLPTQGEGWISLPAGLFATLIKGDKVERVLSSGGEASFHRLRWEGQLLVLNALDEGMVSWHERSSLPYAVSVSAEPQVLRLAPTEAGVLWLKPPVMLDPMRLSAQGVVEQLQVWNGERWETPGMQAQLWTENTLIRVQHGAGTLQLAWTPEQLRAMQEQRLTFDVGQSHGVTVTSAPVGIPLPAGEGLYSALAGQPGWVQLLCGETRGPLLTLEPGQPTFWTVGAEGSCGVTPGTVRVILSPQVPGSGSLVVRVQRESLHTWREGEQKLGLLEPGAVRFGKLVVKQETPLGVGVRARREVSSAVLLDAAGKRLAQGPVLGTTLSPGTYYLGVSVPADEKPLAVALRVFGLEPRSTLPTPEVQQRFREATAFSQPRLSAESEAEAMVGLPAWDSGFSVVPGALPPGLVLVRPTYPDDPTLQQRVLALDGELLTESEDALEAGSESEREGQFPGEPEEGQNPPSEQGEDAAE